MSSGFSLAAADHDANSAADDYVINDALMEATCEIYQCCSGIYSDAGLAASGLTSSSAASLTGGIIATWCKVLAACNLAERRGNTIPDSWFKEREIIRAKLERIQAGARLLPSIAMRGDLRPSWSNLEVDRRYPHSTIRRTPSNSSDAPTVLTRDDTPLYPLPID